MNRNLLRFHLFKFYSIVLLE